jgi:hypothetical protein
MKFSHHQRLLLAFFSVIISPLFCSAAAEKFWAYDVFPTFPDKLNPKALYFEIKPGDRHTELISFTNNTTSELNLKVIALDSSGTNSFKDASEPQTEFGKWAEIHSPAITLKPHQYLEIPFTVSIPINTPEGKYFGGLTFQTIDTTTLDAITKPAVQINTRIILKTHILVTSDPRPTEKQNPLPPWAPFINNTTKAILITLIILAVVIQIRLQNTGKKR